MERPSTATLRLRISLIFAALLLAPALSVAQAPEPSFSIPRTDLFGGFVVNVPDYTSAGSNSHHLQGYELAFTLNLTQRLGLTAAGGQTFASAYGSG
jgi:hypothetical protein